MPVLWRITNHPVLDGVGGLKASARWHLRGRRVVYLAQNPASALLEILVHLQIKNLSRNYTLLKIHIPDEVLIESVGELPENWREDLTITRKLGDLWLVSQPSALLEVPSAIVPHTSNFLLNPEHTDASSITFTAEEHPFDLRLLR